MTQDNNNAADELAELTGRDREEVQRVYVALKTNVNTTEYSSFTGETIERNEVFFDDDTVIGVFTQRQQAEDAATDCGDYRHASDIAPGEPYPDILIYETGYEP